MMEKGQKSYNLDLHTGIVASAIVRLPQVFMAAGICCFKHQ